MERNRWVQVTIIIVVASLLAAAGASHTTLPINGQSIAFASDDIEGKATEAGQPKVPVDASPAGNVPGGLSADDWTAMQRLVRKAQYHFARQASDGTWAYRAPNRAHDLALSLDTTGFHVARYSPEGALLWDLGLSLSSYGEQTFPGVIAEDALSGSRERVEYRWSRDVVEWYVNGPEGVEHGLTLATQSVGTDGSMVELTFALRGSLTPEMDGSGRALRLKDAAGSTVLLYDRLAVYDATGNSLPVHMRLAGCAPGGQPADCSLQLVIDGAGAVYPLTVDPLLHRPITKLTASDAENWDWFGHSVAISEDTVVVGAEREDGASSNRGAAYVFQRNQGGADAWGEVTKLTASDAADGDGFGRSVAISGDTAIVGAIGKDGAGSDRGAAYVFERNQGGADAWGEVVKLTATDAEDSDFFGHPVAISGDTVVVGAEWEDGAGLHRGAAYVFRRNQGGADAWGEVAKLTASDAEDWDRFGYPIAISEDTIVVGAWYEDGAGSNRGAAYVFERNQSGADAWGEVSKLTAPSPADEDFFGCSVAISGDTVVVGASHEDGAGLDRGAAYLFGRNQGGADTWGQVVRLTASDAADGDGFGHSVAIRGDTVVVGAAWEDGAGRDLGAAYVFRRNQGGVDAWGQVAKLTAIDAANSDSFGYSVAISGDTIVVGAAWEDGAGDDRGAAYVLVADDGWWREAAIPRASDAADGDRFGYSVAISGDTIVVGAAWEDGAGRDLGAAYVFERNQSGADTWGEIAKLTASDAVDDDLFGISVAISGDTVVVGASGEDGSGSNRGAAYVFRRNQGGADTWGEVTKLTASDAADDDFFGGSVVISGDTVVVGAYWEGGAGIRRGAAYVFQRNQGGADTWGEVTKLTASDAEDYDHFGHSVAISGDTLVVGADWEDGAGSNRGAAYVFECNQGGADAWGEVTKLTASDAADDDLFGYPVVISGDTIVVGARSEDGSGSNRGAAYVFERNQGGADAWGEVTKLTAPNVTDDDYFGGSVAISGDTVVVGAPYDDGAGSDRGAAYVFERNQGGADAWGEVTKLTASDAADDDYFGGSVAISGNTLVVGADGEDGAGSEHGEIYVFGLRQGYIIYLPLVVNNEDVVIGGAIWQRQHEF